MTYYAYVTLSEEDRIAIFTMDPDTGKLTHSADVESKGRPAPLAVSPDNQFMYIGRRDDLKLSSYRIDHATGGLTHIGEAPLESDPCYLSTDRNGRFLMSAYYNAGHAAVHAIGDDGSVSTPAIEWLATATGAHCMQTDPSNKFAFVPHISGGKGPNQIFQFRFDEKTGNITPNDPFKVSPSEELGPRHYCFHPNKDVLYFSNEQGCSVTAYNFDPASGTLSAFQTLSTLPDDFSGDNSCAQIHIAPSGKFLYAPNRGHNSMACFAVDDATGGLTRVAIVPSEAVPRAFGIDPQSKFLYAAGLESGRIASYSINQNTGDLDPLEVYDVGKGPMWVHITELG